MNIFNNGITIGIFLSMIDIITMGIAKKVTISKLKENWMIIAFILYGSQILLFKYGLEYTSMTALNITWDLSSCIGVSIIGLYYFKEDINKLEGFGILFGLISLILFGISDYYTGKYRSKVPP
jgi:multidrug transporter EmrE-like cation transporter